MNTQSQGVGTFAIAVAVVVMAVVGMMQSNKFLKQQAVAECMKAGVDEYKYSDSTSSTPNMAAYKDCMGQMGYKVE